MSSTILVTGGAGYIGSHTAVTLLERGYEVVIVDNLVNSSQAAIDAIAKLTDRNVAFHKLDLLDKAGLSRIFDEHSITAVIHFAGLKAVGESTEQPLEYYQNNLISTLNLLECMRNHNVTDFVFSSSATVYGDPVELPIKESAPTNPTNPYGRTKQMIEDICLDMAAADPTWRMVLLRYFNPVGAHPSGDIGEDPSGAPNNLVPYVMQVAVGRRGNLRIYGDDWPTPDGTGVRDYIHVLDLAQGHVAALEELKAGCEIFNLGTGSGYSVLEVIKATEKVSDRKLDFAIVARRDGDIAKSLADPTKANEMLKWSAERDLESMLADAWRWQSKNPMGFGADGVD